MAIGFNPFDGTQVDDQYPVLTSLRQFQPVTEVEPGLFYVSRYEDIVEISRNWVDFGQGGFHDPMKPDTRQEDEKNLGETDPPFHTLVRKHLNTVFSPSKIPSFEPLVRDVSRELIGRFADQKRADLVGDYASPLTARVIGRLSGLEADDLDLVQSYAHDCVVAIEDPATDRDSVEVKAAYRRCSDFEDRLRGVIARRRRAWDPPIDFLTALLECTDENGEPISDQRLLTHLSKDLLLGGAETTAHLIANVFYELLSDRSRYERVRQDRSLVPHAVEETLRHLTVVQVLFRRANTDSIVSGTPIPKGSVVALGMASGCRDEAIFDHPGQFDLDRGDVARRHLAFNVGLHHCVGAPLARLEAVCALEDMLDRFPDLSLAPGTEYRRVQWFVMRGPTLLQVDLYPHEIQF
jgi:cytochrome P450